MIRSAPFRFALLLIFSLLLRGDVRAQNKLFQKVWGGSATEVAYTLQQGTDSAVYVFGTANPGPLGQADFCLNKLDPNGNLIRTTYYSGYGGDNGLLILPAGSGWLLIGVTIDTASVTAATDVLILRVDTMGNELWRKLYGGPGNEQCKTAANTADGGFLLAGFCPDSFGSIDGYILRLDSAGNKVFETTYGSGQMDLADGIAERPDHTIAVVGTTKANRNYDMEFLLLDSTGTLLWDEVSADTLTSGAQSMCLLSDGRILGVGETETSPGSAFNGMLELRDSAGVSAWKYNYGGVGREAFFGATQTADDRVVIIGYSNSSTGNVGPEDLSIWCIDTTGTQIWQQSYGGPGFDMGYSACRALDGGLYVCGFYNDTSQQFYLLHLNKDGLLALPEAAVSGTGVKVYPNPARDRIQIASSKGIIEAQLTGISGCCVKSISGSLSNELEVYTGDIAPGFYVLHLLLSDGSSAVARLVLSR